MRAAVNDLSFENEFSSREKAIEKVRQWMQQCRKIESKETTAVEHLYSVMLNTSMEIAPGYPLSSMVREFQTRDDRRYLMHLLANLPCPQEECKEEYHLAGRNSGICAWAREGIVVSLESAPIYGEPVLKGQIGEEEVTVKNIACQEHIKTYQNLLGIRYYEANKKHRKESYIDGAGRYVDAMDLDDEQAQELLNQAVEIDGNLYAKKQGQYYCFQRHHDNCYHGYQNNDLKLHITKKIDEKDWQ